MIVQASLGLMVLSATQAAREGPARGHDDIVVRGRSMPTDAAQARARRYVDRSGVLRGHEQLARWTRPICVRTIGLVDRFVPTFESTIRDAAVEAGVPVAGSGCRPNIVVSFTTDGSSLVRAIRARSPDALSETSLADRDRLVTDRSPIRWWYRTEVRGSDGRELMIGPPPASPTGGEGGRSLLPEKPTLNAYSSSLVSTYGIRTLLSATAVVDVSALDGWSLRAAAQYVAVVTLAEIRMQGDPPVDSVLSMFAREDRTAGLTAEDRAFLDALYHVPLDRDSTRQRAAVDRVFSTTLSAGRSHGSASDRTGMPVEDARSPSEPSEGPDS